MTLATNISEQIPLVRQLTHWWHGRRNRSGAIAELSRCGSEEVERVARDVGVSGAELCILAGKWPTCSTGEWSISSSTQPILPGSNLR
jgi:hypothetical protein